MLNFTITLFIWDKKYYCKNIVEVNITLKYEEMFMYTD